MLLMPGGPRRQLTFVGPPSKSRRAFCVRRTPRQSTVSPRRHGPGYRALDGALRLLAPIVAASDGGVRVLEPELRCDPLGETPVVHSCFSGGGCPDALRADLFGEDLFGPAEGRVGGGEADGGEGQDDGV